MPSVVGYAPYVRSGWIDATRGVAIVLVVGGHAIQFGAPTGSDFFSNAAFATIYAFHMPLFALVSGYLYRKPLLRDGPARSIRRRAKTILIPYLAWTVVLAMTRVLPDLVGAPSWGDAAFAGHMWVHLLWQPGGTVWFLWVIFLCGAITALVGLPNRRLGLALMAATITLVYLVPLEGELGAAQLQWLLPFFLAGFAAHAVRRRLVGFEGAATVVAAVLFVALRLLWHRGDTVYLHHMRSQGSVIETLTRYGYRYLIAFAGIVATVGMVRWVCRRFEPRTLIALGAASLGIYAVQTVLYVLLDGVSTATREPFYLLWVVVVGLLVLAVSYGSTRVLGRWHWTRAVLLGGR